MSKSKPPNHNSKNKTAFTIFGHIKMMGFESKMTTFFLQEGRNFCLSNLVRTGRSKQTSGGIISFDK